VDQLVARYQQAALEPGSRVASLAD